MATESGKDERDGDAELATAVHQVLAILTDLRTDAHTPALRERIKLVQWLRNELGDVEAFLNQAVGRRAPAPAPAAPAPSPASAPAPKSAAPTAIAG